MGFPKIAPLPNEIITVHSQTLFRGSAPFVTRLPSLARVPPSSFLTTSVVYSGKYPAGLLHPAASYGVRRVSGASATWPSRTSQRTSVRTSPMLRPQAISTQMTWTWCRSRRRTTLRSLPLDNSSFRVTADDTLPSFQLPSAHSPCAPPKRNSLPVSFHQPGDLKVLFRCRVRCSDSPFPVSHYPILPWV